jgi:integrase
LGLSIIAAGGFGSEHHRRSRVGKPIARKLEMQGIHWHALRHFNNTLMLAEGVDVKTRMDRLGHVNDRVNIIYSHASDQAQLQASVLIMKQITVVRSQLKRPQPATG